MSQYSREPLQELPKELRAYINQQILEFEPFCLPDSGINVLIEKELRDNDKEEFFVTIEITGDGVRVKSTGNSDDIFAATKAAKETLLDHLYSVQSEMFDEMDKEGVTRDPREIQDPRPDPGPKDDDENIH